MSRTLLSYIRTRVRLFGLRRRERASSIGHAYIEKSLGKCHTKNCPYLFLVFVPTTKNAASFFVDQNSSDWTPVGSNGCISFFLEKEMAYGRFNTICKSHVRL